MIKNLKLHRLLSANYRQLQTRATEISSFETEISSNDYVCSLCRQNLFREAIHAFDFIQSKTPFHLNPTTYTHLISACSSLRLLNFGRIVHHHMVKSNFQPDIILQNHLLNMYGKCGSPEDARNVFDKMVARNLVSWTSIIAGYSQNRREIEAIDLYFHMRRSGILPDHFTFGNMLRVCSGLNDIELGRQFHAAVIKSEYGLERIAQNALVAMYTKFNRIDDALVLFDRISEKDTVLWGSMVGGLAQQGCPVEALQLFKEMLSMDGLFPNEFIFSSAFSACSSLFQLEYGKQLHSLSIKFGLGGDVFAGCSLSNFYAKCGSLYSAKMAFIQIQNPDLVAWNAITAGFAYSCDVNEAMECFSRMRHSGFIPNEITILGLLTSPSTLTQGQQVHCYVIKTGFNLDVRICNTLLTMYAKCSDLSKVFHLFEEMKNAVDLVSWNAVLTACLQHNQVNDVFRLLKFMHSSQYKPDEITVCIVLGACSSLASLKMGNQVHVYVMKSGLETEILVANGLIDMYTKCGALESARNLFEAMRSPDVVSWSSLIVAYAQFGYGDEALKLFETMRSLGTKPNHVTYVGVLSACSRVGYIEEAFHHYRTMEADYGITPTKEHCSCIVDLLARAGRLEEAEKFINQMQFHPDSIIWKTLLAACATQKNVKIGKRAMDGILKLDPSSSAAHVLLCNIYALTGSWEDVATMRTLMRSRNVRKVPGISWIELRDQVHAFMVEDRSHPKISEIYMVLGELRLHMFEAGYVPN
ncbi:pentatricopeptide repeat-containing protein At3g53360, mitochondrial-like [Papaver somniferum]|uniref:pentatricopeptide repeat-containing protein At3g53360, mitochondrial-like n=1 Tax=Papaver somniferum TaxID=3469 RepID=UPI000E6FE9E0|nr:pentatricopeptide repeat-containing protein At3g53360, mitochondrial-like [Papaver somniferum]